MKITVKSRGEEQDIQASPGLKLLEYLQANEIPVNTACGGKGTCQKCRVRVTSGFAAVNSADRKAFSEQELNEGWRLSCQVLPRTSIDVMVPQIESLRSKARIVRVGGNVDWSTAVLACDLGSTGVVISAGSLSSRIEAHLLNRQVKFGADVMTRLHRAMEKGVEPLRESVLETLKVCLSALRTEVPADVWPKLTRKPLYASGNSAMVSLLHGWSIETLAVNPFQPLKRDIDRTFIEMSSAGESSALGTGKYLGSEPQPTDSVVVETLPLLGGFVGADTFACLVELEARGVEAPWMMVDIGTNTEIVLKRSDGKYYFASAPAGPAFEGGNISSGMRAEPGAIAEAWYKDGAWKFETIAHDVARGVCGSGLIDVLSEGVKGGLIHEDGFLPNGRMMLTDQVSILADDIREFQLAKSATRTGCDVVMKRAGEKPRKIYMAGAFAEHLREDSVDKVGLLPAGIPMEKIGNASLTGTLRFASLASSSRAASVIGMISDNSTQIELALQDDFQEAFIQNLNF